MINIPDDWVVRNKMIKFRNDLGVSIKEMADRCHTTKIILGIVENGGVTHPNIVKRIQAEYYLTDEEAEALLPINLRPHSPHYDPEKYVVHAISSQYKNE